MKKIKKEKSKNIINEEVDWKQRYLRAVADYQNLERRIDSQAIKFKNEANQDLLLEILELVDAVDAAEIFIKNEGLQLIKDKISAILEKQGVKSIAIENQEFNPNLAEVVEVDEEAPDNIVTKVLQKGYAINGFLLRPARVTVGKKLSVTSN